MKKKTKTIILTVFATVSSVALMSSVSYGVVDNKSTQFNHTNNIYQSPSIKDLPTFNPLNLANFISVDLINKDIVNNQFIIKSSKIKNEDKILIKDIFVNNTTVYVPIINKPIILGVEISPITNDSSSAIIACTSKIIIEGDNAPSMEQLKYQWKIEYKDGRVENIEGGNSPQLRMINKPEYNEALLFLTVDYDSKTYTSNMMQLKYKPITPKPLPPLNNQNNKKNNINVGEIIGIIIGAVLIVVAIVVPIVLLTKKKKR